MKSILRQKSRDEKNKETQSRAELRRIVRNCAELCGIVRNCAELRGVYRAHNCAQVKFTCVGNPTQKSEKVVMKFLSVC